MAAERHREVSAGLGEPEEPAGLGERVRHHLELEAQAETVVQAAPEVSAATAVLERLQRIQCQRPVWPAR